MLKVEIKKIRKQANKLIVTIPKKSDFKLGDYVVISKLNTNALKKLDGI